jgi:hypothetical protein
MKLLIGAIEYAVEFVPMEGDDVSEIELNTSTISVSPDLPMNQTQVAILHEVIHAMNWKIPENEVEYAAQAWYAFMLNNKGFIQEIIK